MANKFLEQMKASDWINLGQLATNVVGGVASGKAAERTAQQASQQDAWNRLLQQYNAQMAARNQLAAYYDQLNATRAAGRQAFLNASPLGEEQEYVGKQALRRGLMGVMGNFQPLAPASADIAGLIRPTSNVLGAFTTPDMQQAASVGATARSLAERRKAKAGVDPTFQFGSMADYGVPNLEKEVATYAQGVAADRLSRENQLLNLLTTQMQAANALSQPQSMQGVPPTQSSAAAQPKKTSWWKKVLNVAATAAPIVAAPFTGGTSLALIGAGAGALKGALSGGAKGALTGAAMGAATSAIGGGAAGAAAQRGISEGVKESASAAIKRAILNPRALTQLGGAAVGGQTEQVAQMVSPFLPGAKAYVPRQTAPRPMGPGATVSSPLYDRIGPAGQSLPPTGSVTPPDLSGRTSTPTGSGTLGGFRRAGNLFPGMGPAQAQQPFIPMQTPGIQSQLTSPLPTAAPAVTPRLVPTKVLSQLSPEVQRMLEEVGRRRQQPNVMNGASPVGGGGVNAAMRAPTTTEQVRDYLSPVADALAAIGMPGARQFSTTVPYSGSPIAQGAPQPFEQVLNSPIGQLMLGATLGSMPRTGATVETSKALMSGRAPAGYLPPSPLGGPSQAVQKLLPGSSQALLTGRSPVAALPSGQYNLPAMAPSTQKTQLVVADLLQKIEQYKNDPVAVRALIAQMQPYLQQLGVQ